MEVIFFGTPEFAVPTLQRLIDQPNIKVIGVVTQPDKRRGRGSQLIPSAIKKLAFKHDIPVWQPKKIKKHQDTLYALKNAQADAFIVVAYGQILSPEILAMPKLGCINVHGSILPKYRGAAPIQWCLYHGEAETGITTMLMDEGMDTGAMLLKAYTPIDLLDNAHQIAEKLAEQGADLLIETLGKLEQSKINPIPQNDSEATYASLIKKEDYLINWSRSAREIHNQIRGFYPNCVTPFRDGFVKIMATFPLIEAYYSQLPDDLKALINLTNIHYNTAQNPGEVVSIIKNFGPVIQTGEGFLLLREVQR
ncbi:methionyl-tRNA formyltransferase, partial [Aphanothece sacrum]